MFSGECRGAVKWEIPVRAVLIHRCRTLLTCTRVGSPKSQFGKCGFKMGFVSHSSSPCVVECGGFTQPASVSNACTDNKQHTKQDVRAVVVCCFIRVWRWKRLLRLDLLDVTVGGRWLLSRSAHVLSVVMNVGEDVLCEAQPRLNCCLKSIAAQPSEAPQLKTISRYQVDIKLIST